MPAIGSVTKDQLERDLVRLRKQKTELEATMSGLRRKLESVEQHEAILQGTLDIYFPGEAKVPIEPLAESLPLANGAHVETAPAATLEHLSIADSCDVVFRELHNQWLPLADLDTELRQRGKICSKGSIEIALKAKPSRYQVERRGKRHFYRMREPNAVKESRTTKTTTGER